MPVAPAVLLLGLVALQSAEPWDRRRDRIVSRIEEIRGLKFRNPVHIVEGSHRDYAALALENARTLYGGNLDAFEEVLKALGVLSGRIRLELAIPLFASAGVTAYYDNDGVHLVNPLIVTDDELIYKFTLALADQHAIPEKPGAVLSFDARLARLAVRHGDADMTKRLHWDGLKVGDRRPPGYLPERAKEVARSERELSRWAAVVVPPFFYRSSTFLWERGGLFMEALRQEGGAARLDAVCAKPPVSTEQVLHPEKYLRDEPVVSFDLQPLNKLMKDRGYARLLEMTFGEFGIAVFFESLLDDPDPRAPEGWAGDRLAAWKSEGGKTVIVWLTDWDSAADAFDLEREAERAMARYRKERDSDAVVVRGKSTRAMLLFCPVGLRDDVERAVRQTTRIVGSARRAFDAE